VIGERPGFVAAGEHGSEFDAPGTRRAILVGGSLVFTWLLIRTAWLSDDSYITFRTVYNFLHGSGLRWNVSERVETFTHPLWMFVMAAMTAITGETYFTAIVVCSALSLAVVILIASRVAASALMALFVFSALALSRSFVEFSTSGLENALTHLLLVLFYIAYAAPASDARRRVGWLSFVAGLLMLNRLDVGLLVLPALAVDVWRAGIRRVWWIVAAAMIPLAAWEVFSIVYYGFPFPNTAYAKLKTGVPRLELIEQGLLYLLDSIGNDPVTPLVIVASLVFTAAAAAGWACSSGVLLYVAYVVWVGGDFMSGRFLAAPFVCAILQLARGRWWRAGPEWAGAFALLWIAGLAAPRPALFANGAYGANASPSEAIPGSHITDERRYYYPFSGLLTAHRGVRMPNHPWFVLGMNARADGERVHFTDAAGFPGYAAGPSVHYVDHWALGDALLARLPAEIPWQIGHYGRKVPEGYLESVASGRNLVADPGVAAYYERLRTITEGPIWSWNRFRTIYRMNTGVYEHFIASYGMTSLPLAAVAGERHDGDEWNMPGNVIIDRGVRVRLDRPSRASALELTLSNNDRYRVTLSEGDRTVHETSADGVLNKDGRLLTYRLPVPNTVEFDTIRVEPTSGDGRYSLGHLRVIPQGAE
jgi:arabinofuranosyltransferase